VKLVPIKETNGKVRYVNPLQVVSVDPAPASPGNTIVTLSAGNAVTTKDPPGDIAKAINEGLKIA
jgi:hypothetical protein